MACVLGCTLWASENPTVEMEYFGSLPEFTPGGGDKTSWYVPMAVDMGGARPDLVLAAHSRLWFYINESKRGKVLFSEPIVLKSTGGEDVWVLTAAVEQGNQLIIAGDDLTLRRAAVVGEDVPVLQLGGAVLSTTGEPLKLMGTRMVVTDEAHYVKNPDTIRTKALLKLLKQTLPDAAIYCMINTDLKPEISACMEHACEKYGITVVNFEQIDKVYGHPTVRGMQDIKDGVINALTK